MSAATPPQLNRAPGPRPWRRWLAAALLLWGQLALAGHDLHLDEPHEPVDCEFRVLASAGGHALPPALPALPPPTATQLTQAALPASVIEARRRPHVQARAPPAAPTSV